MTKQRKTPSLKPVATKMATKPRKAKPEDATNPLVRELLCSITHEEAEALAMESAKLGVQIDLEAKRLAESELATKRIIREMRERVSQLQQRAASGFELRPVQCREELDTDRQNIVLIRCDTDKVVETLRKATTEDANLSLFEDK